jgi:homospermidine synthase
MQSLYMKIRTWHSPAQASGASAAVSGCRDHELLAYLVLQRSIGPAACSGLDKDDDHGWNKAMQHVGWSGVHAPIRMRERNQ